MSFSNLNISKLVLDALEQASITTPTNIQAQSFDIINNNENAWLKSPTGTGKTLAYILPLIDKILENKAPQTQLIMLTPTHELAIQINQFINDTFSSIGVKSLALIGKASIERQKEKLKKKPQIIVGSVGRILELIEQKKLKPSHFKYCVIDEADRMLEEDSLLLIQKILAKCLKMQFILGSATIKNNALKLAETFIDDIKLIDNRDEINTITHSYILGDNNRKTDLLKSFLNATRPAKVIVFLHKNSDVNFVAKKLSFKELSVGSIHSEQDKIARAKSIKEFKSGKTEILIASDVAARGLDVADIDYVVNYDIPGKPEDYQHRAGRCGRMGRKASSVILCGFHELSFIEKIERKLKETISKAQVSNGSFTLSPDRTKTTEQPKQ